MGRGVREGGQAAWQGNGAQQHSGPRKGTQGRLAVQPVLLRHRLHRLHRRCDIDNSIYRRSVHVPLTLCLRSQGM